MQAAAATFKKRWEATQEQLKELQSKVNISISLLHEISHWLQQQGEDNQQKQSEDNQQKIKSLEEALDAVKKEKEALEEMRKEKEQIESKFDNLKRQAGSLQVKTLYKVLISVVDMFFLVGQLQ